MTKKLKDELVTLDHAVTMARQGFRSLLEKRLAWAAIARTGPATWDPQFQRHSVELGIRELTETFPAIDYPEIYTNIRKVLYTLLTRVYQLETPDGNHWKGYSWLHSAEYIVNAGKIRLTFTDASSQLLDTLKASRFDQYILKEAAGFSNLKSWRLYELLNSYRRTGWLEIEVEKYVSICEINPNVLEDFGQLRRSYIEPAIAEIQRLHGWPIKLTPKKEGRKVVKLRFDFAIKKSAPKARKEAGPQPSSLPLPELGPRHLSIDGEAGLADALRAAHSKRTDKLS